MGEDNERVRKRLQAWIDGYGKAMADSNFDNPFVKSTRVVSAQTESDTNPTAKAIYAFKIPPVYANNPSPSRTTHGGAIATFFDNSTGVALLASKRCFGMGVSRNLSVTYFRPLMAGEEVRLEAEVLSISQRNATIEGRLIRASDGKLIALCVHEKINPEMAGPGGSSL